MSSHYINRYVTVVQQLKFLELFVTQSQFILRVCHGFKINLGVGNDHQIH